MARKRRRRKSRKQNTSLISVLVAIAAVAWGVYTQGGQKQVSIPGITSSVSQKTSSSSNISNSTNAVANAGKQNTVYGGLAKSDYQKLAKLDFKSGGKAYIYVNNNHSTLVKGAWKVNRVIYSNLDKQNRTSSSNTAFWKKETWLTTRCACGSTSSQPAGTPTAAQSRSTTGAT